MIYGLGVFRGMAVTLAAAFRPTFTQQYPDRRIGLFRAAREADMNAVAFAVRRPGAALKAVLSLTRMDVRLPQSPRFRGNEFTWYVDRCTGCANCAQYCPLGIIRIVTEPGGVDVQEGESYRIEVFDIDIGRCMFCGLCVEACPFDALHMGSRFEQANYERANLVLTRDQLIAQAKRPSTWFRPQAEARGYSPFTGELEDSRAAGRHEQPTPEELAERWVDNR